VLGAGLHAVRRNAVRGWPTHTLLRGRIVFQDGAVRDQPGGRYIKRPVGLDEATER
jgi:hypothetical protein